MSNTDKTDRINIRVPKELRLRIERYGKDNGLGRLSDTCRFILGAEMTRIYSAPDRLARRKLPKTQG